MSVAASHSLMQTLMEKLIKTFSLRLETRMNQMIIDSPKKTEYHMVFIACRTF